MWTIYKIVNQTNGREYIGISTNWKSRYAWHRSMLKSGKHINKRLLADHNKGHNFSFKTIGRTVSKQAAILRESGLIAKSVNPYNGKSGSAGRGLLEDKKVRVELWVRQTYIDKVGARQNYKSRCTPLCQCWLGNKSNLINRKQTMKTAEEILRGAIEKYNSQVNDISKFALNKRELEVFSSCMKIYASQFIDEAANKYIPDDNPKIFRDKILKLKQDLK